MRFDIFWFIFDCDGDSCANMLASRNDGSCLNLAKSSDRTWDANTMLQNIFGSSRQEFLTDLYFSGEGQL